MGVNETVKRTTGRIGLADVIAIAGVGLAVVALGRGIEQLKEERTYRELAAPIVAEYYGTEGDTVVPDRQSLEAIEARGQLMLAEIKAEDSIHPEAIRWLVYAGLALLVIGSSMSIRSEIKRRDRATEQSDVGEP